MSISRSIRWFKANFGTQIQRAVQGTPFDENLLAAIAYQETGYVWGRYTDSMSVSEILKICVGDTIDYKGPGKGGRSAFPKNRAELESFKDGRKMFKIARRSLLNLATYEKGYKSSAALSHKFCRGYGIFQYDLQFFKKDPKYFLNKSWEDFDLCLDHCIKELFSAKRRQGWGAKKSLNRNEKVHIAIAYNKGKSDTKKRFKQGHKSDGKYYGENIDRFMGIAEGLLVATVISADDSMPQPVETASRILRVKVNSYLSLRERSTKFSTELVRLRPGQVVVQLLDDDVADDFWRIEASINGTVHRGYAAAEYLVPLEQLPQSVSDVASPIDLKNVPAYIKREIDPPRGSVSVGATGEHVRKVQEWLCLHQVDTIIDNGFGPATQRCVERFQKAKSLPSTGKVNAETWEKLVAPMKTALAAPSKVAKMSLPEAVLSVAKQHAKLRPFEVGGENAGPWVRLYCSGQDGSSWLWCAGFVSFLIKQAAFYRKESPLINGSASCDTLAAQGSTEGRFVRKSQLVSGSFPLSKFGGCAIFLQKKSEGDWNHTGIAFNFSGKGSDIVFDTIEGNTNAGGSRNGGEARQSSRSMTSREYDFIDLS